jgi:nicotinamide riboside transporter PnuC
MKKIRSFFKVDSNYQLFIVNLVFALTGSAALYFADYLLNLFLFTKDLYGIFFYWVTRIILVLPLYQVLLIIIATIFGQFSYFWAMEKKTINKFTKIFYKK